MKYLITFIFCVCCLFCRSQGIKFQLYITKSCSHTEELETFYYFLTPFDSEDVRYEVQNGAVTLPAKGRYKLISYHISMLESPIVEVSDSSLYIFRYKPSKIELLPSNVIDAPPVYVTCDTVISGYQEDFYSNGNIKLRGNFRRGYMVDSVVTFYGSGKTKERVTHLSQVTTIESYDSAGNMFEFQRNQNGSFMLPHDFEHTFFFPNGKIRSKETSIMRYSLREEYYSNSQLKLEQTKTTRTEYYSNGKTRVSYKWKSKKPDIGRDQYNFTVNKREYDVQGKLVKATQTDEWNSNYPQPELCYKTDKN